jgi:hypothetical protein
MGLLESITGADRAFSTFVWQGVHWMVIVGPDGAVMLAGSVDGDPATATEFIGAPFGYEDVGDITFHPP